MKQISIIFTIILISFTAIFAQSAEDAEKMQQAWEASVKVGDQHHLLAKMAGDWTYTTTSYMAPGQEEKSGGKATKEMVCGGRFLTEINTGQTMGMAFEGHNTFAYDNVGQRYRSCWFDNFGTGFMLGEGQQAGNKIEMACNYPDVMGGPDKKYKIIYTIDSDTQHTMDMLMVSPEGEDIKQVHIVYTKVK